MMMAVLCAYAEKISTFSFSSTRSQHEDKNDDNEIQKGGEKQFQMRLHFGGEIFLIVTCD